jgi:hypothetical protein
MQCEVHSPLAAPAPCVGATGNGVAGIAFFWLEGANYILHTATHTHTALSTASKQAARRAGASHSRPPTPTTTPTPAPLPPRRCRCAVWARASASALALGRNNGNGNGNVNRQQGIHDPRRNALLLAPCSRSHGGAVRNTGVCKAQCVATCYIGQTGAGLAPGPPALHFLFLLRPPEPMAGSLVTRPGSGGASKQQFDKFFPPTAKSRQLGTWELLLLLSWAAKKGKLRVARAVRSGRCWLRKGLPLSWGFYCTLANSQ